MAPIVGMGRKLTKQWPQDKIQRFIRDWNEGMDPEALEERYGGKPTRIVVALRAAGYTLVTRSTRDPRPIAPSGARSGAIPDSRHPWRSSWKES